MRTHARVIYISNPKGKPKQMKSKLTRITSTLVVLVLTVTMLFSISADSWNKASAAEQIRKLSSVDTHYRDYLNSAVVQKLPDTVRDDETISVIVMMADAPLLDTYDEDGKETFKEYVLSDTASELRSKVRADRTALEKKLDELDIEYEVGAEYSTILAGYEMIITARDFDTFARSLSEGSFPVVGEVYNAAETKLVENTVDVYEKTGIFDSSDFRYDGEGMVIAVLDTGLDYTHDAFKADKLDGKKLGLTLDEVSAALAGTNAAEFIPGLLAGDVYVSDKVPFAFDYADIDSDVYSIHNNHGTHVSGVIAGDDNVITGVAPKAQIVSMKIFSDTYESAKSTWILSALEDAVELGVDVINMSIGSACGFSRETDEEVLSGVYDRIREKGISLVVAASNSFSSAYGSEKNGNLGLTSNPDTGTVGSPSTYEGAMSIASINGAKTPYMLYEQDGKDTIIYFIEATNSASKEKNFFDDILPDGTDEMKIEYVLIPGVGRPADYIDVDITGKIALVKRGTTTFEEKANAAQQAGAAGIIIFNNTSGDIKMNAGITSIPICSVSQVDGEMLAAAKRGTVTISRSQSSGPFISDFSSWGPTPNLGIKPEITAHGGNILSAVTGNEYDRLSGTSMACPNMSGVIALLRQYVINEYPADEITLPSGEIDYPEVNAIINRLMMSTADVIYNKNGLPYAVRKQGAGLANLAESAATKAYILTYERGETDFTRENAMDKTKIELGDDPAKTGIYTLTFSVYNFGNTSLSYDISAFAMTEGVSETPTYKGDTVVTEEGYMLTAGVLVESAEGGTLSGTTLTVEAGKTANVTVKITLSDADKSYLDASFKNGMYVEGFVMLKSSEGKEMDLNVPYLAFYGDWTKAPLFDTDYFETNRDELDDSIELLDKNLPDAYATRPIGGIESDYINYLGSYYFIQNPEDKIIAASRDYVAISNYEGTVHSLRFVWAGLLRNAEKIVITITDDSTGEVIFTRVENDIRKSYGDGGSIYPANVEIEFDASEHNLKNNTTYTVKLQGYLDYGNGGLETNEKSTFEFPITADFEAPAVTGVEYYTEYDRDAKKTRLFARVAVYDNHYAMSMQVGYITEPPANSEYDSQIVTFSNYLTPIYSSRNSTTYVTYELTDYIYDIKNNGINGNTIAISVYDYALNVAVYELALPDTYTDFTVTEKSVTLNPNEVYTLAPLVYPETEWAELLEYSYADTGVVKVVNNKLVAIKSGTASVFVYDPKDDTKIVKISVKVRAEGDDGYKELSKPVADEFDIIGYETLKAYYLLDSSKQDIGETGDTRAFDGTPYLSLYPSESVRLNLRKSLYFPEDTEVMFISGNEKVVSVDENGVITANGEGNANVTVRLKLNGKNTSFSRTVRISVKDPYVRSGPSLSNYYGVGGIVEIPEDLLFTEIGQYAFSNYNYIPKDPDEITEDEPDTTKIWYIGDNTITKVIIPEGVEKIGPYAFANLTALKEVVLPKSLKYIEYGAFYGCSKLEKVSGLESVVTINKNAFFGCDLHGSISLDSAHAIADYAFAMNDDLESVTIPETLRSIGQYAFAGNTRLATVTVNADKVKLGAYAFTNCTSLEEISINTSVIPAGAFYNCRNLETVKLGRDVEALGEYAFAKTKASFEFDPENTRFEAMADGKAIVRRDTVGDKTVTTLVLVSPDASGEFTLAGVEVIGTGAFSGNDRITSVNMPDAVHIGSYAFAECTRLSSVSLGALEVIDSYAFFNTPIDTLPAFADSLTSIGKYAFAYTDLTSVVIPDGVRVLEGAFCECTKLESVIIGNDAVLGTGAFMLGRDSVHLRYDTKNWEFIPTTLNGQNIYYHRYLSKLVSLTIGDGVVIGDSAFLGAASLIRAEIGSDIEIGRMAFYNAASLADIDLSGVTRIGEMAFSGDVIYQYTDPYQQSPLIDDETGDYIYRYYSPVFKRVDLSSLADTPELGEEGNALGKQAFQYCKSLVEVVFGDGVLTIPYMTFDNCSVLTTANLGKVETVGESAFAYTALINLDLSSATTVSDYAFLYCEALESVKLAAEAILGEGAFAYCEKLATAEDLGLVQKIDAYAFAYTAITDIDLTNAVSVGDLAFMKPSPRDDSYAGEKLSAVTVTLGEKLETLGDNPFANCTLAPFSKVVTTVWNEVEYHETVYTYDISEYVKVIDGSLYCVVPYGLELTVYAGITDTPIIPEGTVRISAMAFAASDIIRVTLPHTLNSIGHKAFYDCMKLKTVVFKSYEAPILEEEFDQNYFFSGENFPDINEYSNGDEDFLGLGIISYPMYITLDAEEGKFDYSTVYYGANFVDYIGHGADKLVMIAPSNGKHYDSFIMSQYFDTTIGGSVAADDSTVAAIEAIEALPTPVLLEHEALVIAARAAYDRLSSLEQKALVYNYSVLLTAETRIEAFKNTSTPDDGDDKPTDTPTAPEPVTPPAKKDNGTLIAVLAIIEGVIILLAIGCGVRYVCVKIAGTKAEKETTTTKNEAEATEVDAATEDYTTNE